MGVQVQEDVESMKRYIFLNEKFMRTCIFMEQKINWFSLSRNERRRHQKLYTFSKFHCLFGESYMLTHESECCLSSLPYLR